MNFFKSFNRTLKALRLGLAVDQQHWSTPHASGMIYVNYATIAPTRTLAYPGRACMPIDMPLDAPCVYSTFGFFFFFFFEQIGTAPSHKI